MKMVLMGVRHLDFDGDDGTKVVGTQIFTSYESDGVVGLETSKHFLSTNKTPPNLTDYVGSEIDLIFNQKGKVVGLTCI